jgi:Na+/serine symporter
MSKTEILRQLSDAANEKRIERLANQIESLRQAKHQSVEDLSMVLEPLAQAMAALTDETRQTLLEIDRKSREQGELFRRQLSESMKAHKEISLSMIRAAESLNQAGQKIQWTHYVISALTGAITAALVSVFWLYLAPQQIYLDARAVAAYLKPAIEASRLSANR